jgi:hypothetical protein
MARLVRSRAWVHPRRVLREDPLPLPKPFLVSLFPVSGGMLYARTLTGAWTGPIGVAPRSVAKQVTGTL